MICPACDSPTRQLSRVEVDAETRRTRKCDTCRTTIWTTQADGGDECLAGAFDQFTDRELAILTEMYTFQFGVVETPFTESNTKQIYLRHPYGVEACLQCCLPTCVFDMPSKVRRRSTSQCMLFQKAAAEKVNLVEWRGYAIS